MTATARVARPWTFAGRLSSQRLLLPALLALFFCSGISGLIYELVWLRYLALVFGVTIYAVSTVLSAFMGGLALGGYLAGRIADRLHRPLRLYGLVELGIGITALLTPAGFAALGHIYRALYPGLPHDLTSLSLVRFVLACVILLIPTTLMGATLPIVVRSTLGKQGSLGTNLSLLYASNTAGGITGAYVAGFILIGWLGIRATTMTAAVVNVAVGLLAVSLDWYLGRAPLASQASSHAVTAASTPAQGARRNAPVARAHQAPQGLSIAAQRWLLAAFFISGFASLGYQVIWTRILAIFFEATTYAFTLILCTFLLGIAIGSYAIAPFINRKANWLFIAASMEWAVGVSALVSIFAISHLRDIVERFRYLPILEHLVSGEQRVTALMAFITIIPTTLLLGAAFPIIMKLYAGNHDEAASGEVAPGEVAADGDSAGVGFRLGRAYSANVLGSIAGSWASGFVLIPLLGTHRSLVLLAFANTAVGLGLLRYALSGAGIFRARVLMPAGLAIAVGATALTPDMYSAVFARFGDPVLWYEEGLEQTVTILEGHGVRRMYLNGWHQANDTPSMLRVHTFLGHLPMLVEPAPDQVAAASTSTNNSGNPPAQPAAPAARVTGDGQRDVLVIGLGGGATAGAAAAHDGAQLTVVELSDSVVRGARFFAHVNENVVDAPNVHIDTDDGRNFLLLNSHKYDVIMADAIRPQHAGSSSLYSLEYYSLARAALKDNGVMVQWIDAALPATQYQILLRTFLRAFPYVTGWQGANFFVGSNHPYKIDPALVARRLNGTAKVSLAPLGLANPESLLALYSAGDAELRAWVGDGPIVTDDHPYVEFFRSLDKEQDPPDLSVFKGDWHAVVK